MPDVLAEVGPWARDKLGTLARYLDFYGKVLSGQKWKTIYLDAYAGGGRALIRAVETEPRGPDLFGTPVDANERELIDGSPRIALGIKYPFARYVFVEPTAKRYSELEKLKAEQGSDRYIKLIRGTARDGIDWVTSQSISKSTHRGVAFLDPFGVDLAWADIKKLADTELFEVFINLSLNMGVVRMLPNDGDIQESWAVRLDALFGDRAWHGETYEAVPGLFGDTRLAKRPDYEQRLLALYTSRLKGVFQFVSSPRLVSNTRGCPLYYLLWAGNNAKGREGADHVLTMGEKLQKVVRPKGKTPSVK